MTLRFTTKKKHENKTLNYKNWDYKDRCVLFPVLCCSCFVSFNSVRASFLSLQLN